MIFEAQIGFSVFSEVNQYSPYPQVRNLIDDLNRISQMGFSCIQLMPKQPYPSYNVHDYADIGISYGDVVEIKELIQKAHAKGIKVIFDVLLHGVLDKEIIKIAADAVRSGPYKALLKGTLIGFTVTRAMKSSGCIQRLLMLEILNGKSISPTQCFICSQS